MNTEEKQTGVYVRLLHGRNAPDERLKDWGFEGPVLGPFQAVHFTYTWHVRCIPYPEKGDEIEFEFYDDLLVYDGKYYGDLEIVSDPAD